MVRNGFYFSANHFNESTSDRTLVRLISEIIYFSHGFATWQI
jgi:hypothetical protein